MTIKAYISSCAQSIMQVTVGLLFHQINAERSRQSKQFGQTSWNKCKIPQFVKAYSFLMKLNVWGSVLQTLSRTQPQGSRICITEHAYEHVQYCGFWLRAWHYFLLKKYWTVWICLKIEMCLVQASAVLLSKANHCHKRENNKHFPLETLRSISQSLAQTSKISNKAR